MLYSYTKFTVSVLKRSFYAFLFCILIAFIDEIIQFFSPGRAFELYDMALDGLGSIIGILLIFLIYKKESRKKLFSIPMRIKKLVEKGRENKFVTQDEILGFFLMQRIK